MQKRPPVTHAHYCCHPSVPNNPHNLPCRGPLLGPLPQTPLQADEFGLQQPGAVLRDRQGVTPTCL